MNNPKAFHPLPATAPFCRVIPGFLSLAECRALIAEAEARGFHSAASDYPPSYRTNDRQVVDDEALAGRLLERLQGEVPDRVAGDGADAAPWCLDAINARFRLCRYLPGQSFAIHQDGVHHRCETLRSHYTFMVYLTDGDDFAGGDTVFFEGGPGGEPREIGRVRPRAGNLIVFDHALWHAGDVVKEGIKHVLRSDLLYRQDASGAEPAPCFESAHRGYIWALEALAAQRFASAGRDARIHVWDEAGRRMASLDGHARSVLAMAAFGENRLASVSRDRSLRLWNLDTGACTRVVEDAHAATPLAVIALPDHRIATSGADGVVRLWTSDGDGCGVLAPAGAWVWAIVGLPGGRIAGACEDGSIRIWSLADGRCTSTLEGSAPLRALASMDDGQWLVSGDIDGRVCQRRSMAGAWEVVQVETVHAAAVRRIRQVGGHDLASVGEDGAVRLSSLGRVGSRALGAHANFATDVVHVAGRLLSCGYDGRIRRLGEQGR